MNYRWFLAYTLISNPSLISLRRREKIDKSSVEQKKKENSQEIFQEMLNKYITSPIKSNLEMYKSS